MDHAEQLSRTLDKAGMPREPAAFKAAGEMEQRAEDASINLASTGVYRFRQRHPVWYGLIAFFIGGGAVAIFTMTTYRNWVFEGVNLTAAVYQVVIGGLIGGIVVALLAFAYAAMLRPVARLQMD